MQLQLQSFSSLLQTMAAGLQGAATRLLDLSVGSTLRAILEANASIGLWIQWLIVQVLGVTRAATSTGADLDSFTNDFALSRLPAQSASGVLTLSRYTPFQSAFIPAGAQIRSTDGSQTFTVTVDATKPSWNAELNGYTIGGGVSSIDLPAMAATAGAAGNIQPGVATVLATAIPGIDTVTNAVPFASGLDGETDAGLRARFSNYIQSRSRGTRLAIASAIDGVRGGLSYAIAENTDAGGNSVAGSILVTLDDGTGSIPSSLVGSVFAAVDAVRPVGTTVTVRSPVIINVSIIAKLAISDESRRAEAVSEVSTGMADFVNSLPIGAPVYWSRLAQVAYDASILVINVSGLQLNGSSLDVTVPAYGVAKTSAVSVS